MNIEQELDRMIKRMNDSMPGAAYYIICSPKALERLEENSHQYGVYTSESGGEMRYRGIPIIVSAGVEPGKVYICVGRPASTYTPVSAYTQTFNGFCSWPETPEGLVDINDDSFMNILNDPERL